MILIIDFMQWCGSICCRERVLMFALAFISLQSGCCVFLIMVSYNTFIQMIDQFCLERFSQSCAFDFSPIFPLNA
jgi:hypothetical protein